ncbi:MAG TPA: hypothetical protein VN745_08895 [Verrucomicrobiae bacterium]|nr:hypothetical protein [Verrucomicrobiae bacterium]
MSLGFNSDVTVAGGVFHVQTENYGEPQYKIVTVVYHRGRILHRRNFSYSEFLGAPEFSESALAERIEAQHGAVIEEIERGEIRIPAAPAENSAQAPGIQVRLRNANSWLANGFATLDVEVLERGEKKPARGASVEAHLSDANEKAHFTATTGADGLAQLRFAVPAIAAHGAELVIRARTQNPENSAAVDEIRYVLRAKPKPSPAESKS